jgi:hypothetical protein
MRKLDNSALEGLLRGWAGAEQAARAPLHPGYPDRQARRRLALALIDAWRRSCARRPGLQEALQDRQLASLAYHFDAAALAGIIRLTRRQGGPAASERWADLLWRLDGFLARLAGRLEEGSR